MLFDLRLFSAGEEGTPEIALRFPLVPQLEMRNEGGEQIQNLPSS